MRTSALRASWLLEAESIDFRGRIVSTATSANPSDYTMVFKATNPAGTGVRMAGICPSRAPSQVISPNDVVFDGMVATRNRGEFGLAYLAPGNIRFGTVTAKQGGGFENRGAAGSARRSICVPTPAAGSKSRQGPSSSPATRTALMELTAGGDITVIGTVVGGGTIGSNGATTGRATTPK
jgi:hypothetical protein